MDGRMHARIAFVLVLTLRMIATAQLAISQ
jgi:hypothetical protein